MIDHDTVDRGMIDWDQRPAAPVWRRLVARALDAVTVLMVMWVLGVLQLLWFVRSLADRFHVDPWGRAFVPTVTFVVLATVYETVFLRHNEGQTPGKDVMNLRVVRAGGVLTTGRIAARAVVVSAVWLIPSVPLAAATFVAGAALATVSQRLAVHDEMLGTRVVPFDRSREDPDAPPRPRFLRGRSGSDVDPDRRPDDDPSRHGRSRRASDARSVMASRPPRRTIPQTDAEHDDDIS